MNVAASSLPQVVQNPLLEADAVGRKVGGRWLFRDLSFAVIAGEAVAISGATAVGKSVLLRSLVRLKSFDTGVVRWQGKVIRADRIPEFRSQTIYLQQRPTPDPKA